MAEKRNQGAARAAAEPVGSFGAQTQPSATGPKSDARERPILFSAPMVRAILDGTKTQTRRVVFSGRESRPGFSRDTWGADGYDVVDLRRIVRAPWSAEKITAQIDCPHGKPGDRLWVRETFAVAYRCGRRELSVLTPTGKNQQEALRQAVYRATAKVPENLAITWRPSIFMPRWASRITLEITEVRVERLQDISEWDACCEGVRRCEHMTHGTYNTKGEVCAFATLWDSINGKRPGCAWDDSPWVWAISFRRLGG